MSVINTIRGTAKKVIKEGYKQYPNNMTREEYLNLKREVERELEMNEAHSQAFKDAVAVLVKRGMSYQDAVAKVRGQISEADQVNELSTNTKLDYIRSAAGSAGQHAMHMGADIANRTRKPGQEPSKAEKDSTRKYMNRQSGIQRAARMLSKEEVTMDEALGTMANIKKASQDAAKRSMDKNTKPGDTPAWLKQAIKDRASKKVQKKEFELDEGRGRPPKEGSAAWHKAQAAKKGEEGETQEADKNIHTQLHKVISANKPVTFNNGKTHKVEPAHAHKALALLQNSKPSERLALQHSLSHSHDRFHETIKSGKAITEPAKPKITLAKRVAEEKQMSDVFTSPMEKEEKREGGEKAPKGGSADLTADSRKKYESDPLFSKVKIKLPPTVGNKGAGGEDTVYGKGKFSVAEEKTLNNLYEDLSEENRVMFDEIIKTEEGVAQLLAFATEQGY